MRRWPRRELVGDGLALGFSTHGVGEARQRFAAGADYVFLGPIFPTPEKLKYGDPLGLDALAQARDLPGPVVLIGGINADNCASHSGWREAIAAISPCSALPTAWLPPARSPSAGRGPPADQLLFLV
jgi:thiamine-phosphate pyrophosphorylase